MSMGTEEVMKKALAHAKSELNNYKSLRNKSLVGPIGVPGLKGPPDGIGVRGVSGPGYVLGFMFSRDLERVLLIRKNRPAFQAGKFNGIGGKIEGTVKPLETPLQAMVREFEEEAGQKITDWKFLKSFHVGNEECFQDCYVYYTIGDHLKCDFAKTDEELWVIGLKRFLRTSGFVVKVEGVECRAVEGVPALVQECLLCANGWYGKDREIENG